MGEARRGLRAGVALAAFVVALAASAGVAQGHPPYAPLDQPGVSLSVPRDKLRASLACEKSVRDSTREPVLLNPATGVTPEQNYSWNWERALSMLHIPWCAYTAPAHTLNDIQV